MVAADLKRRLDAGWYAIAEQRHGNPLSERGPLSTSVLSWRTGPVLLRLATAMGSVLAVAGRYDRFMRWGKANLVSTTGQQTPIFGTMGRRRGVLGSAFLEVLVRELLPVRRAERRLGEDGRDADLSAVERLGAPPVGLELATGPCYHERAAVAGRGHSQRGGAWALQVAIVVLGDVQDVEPGVATGTQDDHFPGLAPGVAGVGRLECRGGHRLAACRAQLEPGVPVQRRKLRRRCW